MTNSEVEKLVDEKVAAYFNKLQSPGPVPSGWARDGWYSVCMAGIMDGSNPTAMISREQVATIIRRLGLIPQLTCPENGDFSKVVAGKFTETFITG